jgi:hypothetical protein
MSRSRFKSILSFTEQVQYAYRLHCKRVRVYDALLSIHTSPISPDLTIASAFFEPSFQLFKASIIYTHGKIRAVIGHVQASFGVVTRNMETLWGHVALGTMPLVLQTAGVCQEASPHIVRPPVSLVSTLNMAPPPCLQLAESIPKLIGQTKLLTRTEEFFCNVRGHSFLLKSTVRRDAQAHRFPIQLKSVLPHRFSMPKRHMMREKMANQYQLDVKTLQIKSVYERVHLACYEALKPQENGGILAWPKTTTKQPGQPVYLIIGHPVNNPTMVLQTLIPMNLLSECSEP